MPSVEFRIIGGVLEYRCLIIHERNSDWGGCDDLYTDYKKRYTDWCPVPKVPS